VRLSREACEMVKVPRKELLLALLVFAMSMSHQARAEKAAPPPDAKQYVVGICFSAGAGMDAQFTTLFKDVISAMKEKEKINVILKLYSDESEFISDVKQGKLDFAMTSLMDSVYVILKNGKMKPIFSYSLFNRNKVKYCLYAKKDGRIKKLSDMKGMRVATYDEFAAFLLLMENTHTVPNNEYDLKMTPNASSAIYMLSLNDLDALFIIDSNIDYFQMTNPGPVKNIAQLLCSEEITTAPFFVSRRVSPDLSNKVLEFCTKADREKSLKKYWSLMKMIKFKLVPVSEKDYDSLVRLFESKEKNKGLKEYTLWKKYQKVK